MPSYTTFSHILFVVHNHIPLLLVPLKSVFKPHTHDHQPEDTDFYYIQYLLTILDEIKTALNFKINGGLV